MLNRCLPKQRLTLIWAVFFLTSISSSPVNAQVPELPDLDSSAASYTLAAAPTETAYTLGAGDVVRIEIFKVPQYSGESEVSVDGLLNLPLIGPVNVAGLTIEESTAVSDRQPD